MNRPINITQNIWDLINRYADEFNVDPYLVAAIGWHETQWGRLGAGRRGYYTGYGVFGGGRYAQGVSGLENQIRETTDKMAKWGMRPGVVTFGRLEQGQRGELPSGIYATDPNWGRAVFSIYQRLRSNNINVTSQQNRQPAAEPEPEPVITTRPTGLWETPLYFVAITILIILGTIAFFKAIDVNIDPASIAIKSAIGNLPKNIKTEV